MPLHRPSYLVELTPDTEPITVVVSSGDQLRAELEQQRLHLPERAPMHTTVLWLWSALVRAGLEDRKAGAFIADPPEWTPVNRPDGSPVLDEVDPTGAEPSDSA